MARLASERPRAVDGIAADLGTADGCAALGRAVPAADILVNNLGIFEPKPFDEIPDADWLRFFEVNVMSGVRLSRFYLPGMLAKDWGRIVFISSECALQIPVEMIHYGMTKTAQLAVARGLAETVAGTGVTVNAVLPGPTRSEGVDEFFAKLAKEQGVPTEELEKRVRHHRPSDLAPQAVRDRRGGREHGGLCLLARGVRDHRRGAAGRWRRGALDRVTPIAATPPGV